MYCVVTTISLLTLIVLTISDTSVKCAVQTYEYKQSMCQILPVHMSILYPQRCKRLYSDELPHTLKRLLQPYIHVFPTTKEVN